MTKDSGLNGSGHSCSLMCFLTYSWMQFWFIIISKRERGFFYSYIASFFLDTERKWQLHFQNAFWVSNISD